MKTVMVTGAGGSIGSEICRFLKGKADLVLFEQSELALFNVEREVGGEPVLGDVTRVDDLLFALDQYQPDVIYHAAAYKHVTLCEKNPVVAARVNVRGTRNLVNIARNYNVPKLVLISTDKAVKPACVMGQTKAEAEAITLGAGYTVVRLGNVLGSNGSVLPIWRREFELTGKITITDPAATRWLIDPETAARRIVEAGEDEFGGKVVVPNMGAPVSVLKLAQALGYTQYDIVGLRPGEKLHEELFNYEPLPTSNPHLYMDGV